MTGTTGNTADLLEGPNGIVLDRRSRRVRAGDEDVLLTKQGFDLLALLLENRGDVLTKEYLAQAVWHHDAVSDLHFLHTAVYRLRAALKAAGNQSPIIAVRGVGYTIPGTPFGGGVFRPRDAYESALRSSVVPTMITDTTRRIRFANEAFAKLVGYTVEELLALPSAAVLTPGDLQGVRAELTRRVFDGEVDRSEQVPVERRDGTLIEVPMVAVSPLSIDGAIVGAVIECITPELYQGDHVATPSIGGR